MLCFRVSIAVDGFRPLAEAVGENSARFQLTRAYVVAGNYML